MLVPELPHQVDAKVLLSAAKVLLSADHFTWHRVIISCHCVCLQANLPPTILLQFGHLTV